VPREVLAHRSLVGHSVRDVGADSRQAEPIGRGSRSSDRAIAADGGETVNSMPAGNLDERIDVAEVDQLGHIRFGEPDGKLIAVRNDNAKPRRSRMSDRRKLGDATSEDQHRRHRGRS
jgi:hypothetical protein